LYIKKLYEKSLLLYENQNNHTKRSHNNNNNNNNNDDNDDNDETDDDVNLTEFIIDPHLEGPMYNRLLLAYINDCRNELTDLIFEDADVARQNVIWIEVEHDGWPATFFVTSRNVTRGEKLYCDYGDRFCT
jgi:hypothetical protein